MSVSGLVKPDTAPKVGRLTGAETILSGNLMSEKQAELKVNPEMLSVTKNKPLQQKDVHGQLKELNRIEKDILKNSLKSLKIVPTKEEWKDLEIPLSEKPDAYFPLFKGVDASDQKKWKEAGDRYEEAFKIDPGLIKFIKELLTEMLKIGLPIATYTLIIEKLTEKDKGEKKGSGISPPVKIPGIKFP